MKVSEFKIHQLFNRFGQDDTQNVFTPPSLCREMLSHIKIKGDEQILVLYNVEFASILHKELGIPTSSIYVYTNSLTKRQALEYLKFNVIYSSDVLSGLNEVNMKFDIVVGNPPYQNSDGKGFKKLWSSFVDKGMELLIDNGKLVFITPSSWLNSNSRSNKTFLKYKIEIAKLFESDKNPFPGVGTTVSYYVISKTPRVSKPFDLYFGSDIIKIPYGDPKYISTKNPSVILYNIINKVLFSNPNKLNIKKYAYLHTDKVKNIKSINITPTRNKRIFNGVSPYYINFSELSNINPLVLQLYNVTKLIIPRTGSLNKSLICSDCFTTENSLIYIGKNLKGVQKFLNSKMVLFLNYETLNGQATNMNFIQNLPNIGDTVFDSDQEIYEYFNLTQDEIDLIESTIK
jgi:hypothetical protein